MNPVPSEEQSSVRSKTAAIGGLSFYGLLPCPVKVPFEDSFHSFAGQYSARTGKQLHYAIEANANKHSLFSEYLDTVETAEELPDVMLVPGYSTFFGNRFREKFIRTGIFTDQMTYTPSLLEYGLRDPAGNYSVLAMNTLVIVADLSKAPFVPESWGDLLDERFARRISIRGDDRMFCDAMLTYFDKNFGQEGISRLAHNVLEGLHPAQMVKKLANPHDGQPCVYVMPYFYARMVNSPRTRLIWPAEGALLNPIFLLTKTGKAAEHRELMEFLSGPETARAFRCAGFFFNGSNAGPNTAFPEEKAFNWIGWDYLYGRDMGKTVRSLNRAFFESFKPNG